ncbi:MAG: response regulator [Ktedonobacterales bacterium]
MEDPNQAPPRDGTPTHPTWPSGGDPSQSAAAERRTAGVVLVAENEENNRLLMEQILSLAGYYYLSASNGLEVLRILEREPVDVVLLDLSMPVLDGLRTTELIRRRPELATLPVVAVTGHAASEDRDEALEAGFTAYLAKPFRPQELVSMVERMLRLRGDGRDKE